MGTEVHHNMVMDGACDRPGTPLSRLVDLACFGDKMIRIEAAANVAQMGDVQIPRVPSLGGHIGYDMK